MSNTAKADKRKGGYGVKREEQNKSEPGQISYSHLYRHAQARGNLIRCFAGAGGRKALFIGGRCCEIERLLNEWCNELMVVTPEEWPEKEMELTGPYDVILHLGTVPAGGGSPVSACENRMRRYRELLSGEGTLLFAAPNRLGLKYFAGCQDDCYDVFFAGPEGYSGEMEHQALSRREYQRALSGAGFSEAFCYYPYPDYLFPITLYSDEYLPGTGELTRNIRNFDKDRYVFFDEGKVFDSLVAEGLFPEFSNSFLFYCTIGRRRENETVIYSRCSNERNEAYRIRTDIFLKDGEKKAVKFPLTKEAETHVRKLEANYRELHKAAEGTHAVFSPVRCENGGAVCAWVKGVPMQQMLQTYLDGGRLKEADRLILAYMELVKKLSAANVVDVDLIFANILIEGEVWNIIDYEWSFEGPLPAEWIIYRALFHASIELSGYEAMKLPRLLALAGIGPEEARRYEKGEMEFQAHLSGSVIPLQRMPELLGREAVPFEAALSETEKEAVRLINLRGKDAKRLFFHLDRAETEDGKGILCGWACAKTKNHEFIPVHIAVFDQEGTPVPRPVVRNERRDAADALGAGTASALWGFSVSFALHPDRQYTIRFAAGKCQEEICLQGMG